METKDNQFKRQLYVDGIITCKSIDHFELGIKLKVQVFFALTGCQEHVIANADGTGHD